MMRVSKAVPVLLLLALALVAPHLLLSESAAAQGPVVVGRVRVTPVETTSQERVRTIERLLERRFAGRAAGGVPTSQIISVGPNPEAASLYSAILYDYAVEKGFELSLDEAGNEIGRRSLDGQPDLARDEPERAQAIVKRTAPWSAGIADGSLRLYEPMPPVFADSSGRRRINVGIMQATNRPGMNLLPVNEIVSVHIPSGAIQRHAGGAPPTSSATAATCGPPAQTSCTSIQSCANASLIEWPSTNPIWSLKIRHPYCTRSVQANATGIELTDVSFQGKLVLSRAEMPVLNVEYEGDVCGPYRDWLWEEDCFQATGTDVAPGIRVTSGAPPVTFCEQGTDQGNFRGVAIYDEGSSLWLVTEAEAGWYRYLMQWRLHADGRIEPIFAFGGVENSCTCAAHHHHAYWRFEFGLDGVAADPATGIATVAWQRPGAPASPDPIASEGRFDRSSTFPENDWLRIENPGTGTAWILMPSARDGSALGDSYAKGDLWALAQQSGEINDQNVDTSIRLDPWVNGEPLGASKRLVLWYRGGWAHDESHTGCGFAGPTLAPAGLDRDGDGRTVGFGDCDDGNPLVWSTPAEVTGVRLSHDLGSGMTQLQWTPAAGGATAPVYDAIRSSNPADFAAGSTCIESDGQDTSATDGTSPGLQAVFFYQVRAENSCPSGLGQGPLGKNSAGQERSGRLCP